MLMSKTTGTAALSAGNLAVRRYRSKNRRIDYVVGPAALAALQEWRARGLDNCLSGAIDQLILAGAAAMSGQIAKGQEADVS